jgi:hypothetical protein
MIKTHSMAASTLTTMEIVKKLEEFRIKVHSFNKLVQPRTIDEEGVEEVIVDGYRLFRLRRQPYDTAWRIQNTDTGEVTAMTNRWASALRVAIAHRASK